MQTLDVHATFSIYIIHASVGVREIPTKVVNEPNAIIVTLQRKNVALKFAIISLRTIRAKRNMARPSPIDRR
ncbi:hypothetical protein HMPREF0185_00970 [Brevundimonas diminuta 470-4]|nr:hypothetical protein HMPREF0185_00970 [Brevundimonas diminuta 470-4]